VLDAHRSVIAAMAPGVSWPDLQLMAVSLADIARNVI
jgi:Xaa-Pro aminopeptidase